VIGSKWYFDPGALRRSSALQPLPGALIVFAREGGAAWQASGC
jgi:hypothetical protein